MNATRAIFTGRVLAALSIVFCWLLPYSPFLSIAALKATESARGTYRRKLAVAGAVLSAFLTVLLGVVVAWEAPSLWR